MEGLTEEWHGTECHGHDQYGQMAMDLVLFQGRPLDEWAHVDN
jgi:hypothetical protein